MKDRRAQIKHINSVVFEKFDEKIQAHRPIRDIDIRRWAIECNNKSENKILLFKASKTWLKNFKNCYSIVNRKVIFFVLGMCLLFLDNKIHFKNTSSRQS
jgi:hypothetical protein